VLRCPKGLASGTNLLGVHTGTYRRQYLSLYIYMDLYVCMNEGIYIYMYICIHKYVVRTHRNIQTSVLEFVHIHGSICMYELRYIHIYVHMYIQTYRTYTQEHTDVRIYMYIYIYIV